MPAHKVPLDIRFWAKVEKSDPGGCWLWTAGRSADGYGHIKIEGRMEKAHRVSYELAGGLIPVGLVIDHLCHAADGGCPGGPSCEHRRCVNPEHLQPVTRRVNNLRGMSPLADKARQTHCLRGHEFTDENTYWWHGGRICRQCRHELYLRRKAS